MAALTVCCLAAFSLSACGSKGVPFESINISEYKWALNYNPEIELGRIFPQKDGYTILIREDGTYDAVHHDGIYLGKIRWTNNGLFYVDRHNDYWMTERGNIKNRHPQMDENLDIVTLNDGTNVPLYNIGGDDASYRIGLSISTPQASNYGEIRTKHGSNDVNAACGTNVYSGYPREIEDEEHQGIGRERVLDQTVSNKTIQQKNIITQDTMPAFTNTSDGAQNAPCLSEHEVVFIAQKGFDDTNKMPSADDPIYPLLQAGPFGRKYMYGIETVDTQESKTDFIPLIDSNGHAWPMHSGHFAFSDSDKNAMTDDHHLLWVDNNARLLRTDINSGVTEVINDDFQCGTVEDEQQQCQVYMTTNALEISMVISDDDSLYNNVKIVTLDKASGKTKKVVKLEGLDEFLPDKMMTFDIAMKP
ncbi:hypothetical protein [Bifidobacterium dolichotidis]|nr:hypothetical protein [Bifidobacterium dolichotidis]